MRKWFPNQNVTPIVFIIIAVVVFVVVAKNTLMALFHMTSVVHLVVAGVVAGVVVVSQKPT